MTCSMTDYDAIPDESATAAVPFSNNATRFSNTSTVGFIIRE